MLPATSCLADRKGIGAICYPPQRNAGVATVGTLTSLTQRNASKLEQESIGEDDQYPHTAVATRGCGGRDMPPPNACTKARNGKRRVVDAREKALIRRKRPLSA